MTKKRKKTLVYFYLILFIIILIILTFNSSGLLNFYQLQIELNESKMKIEEVDQMNTKLDAVNDSLVSNDIKIEEVARERHNMKKENEEVLKISEEN
ncbi:MAG: septum formation initiator family protein [Melioribacteraceae bacterium]|nr:septum formation initiator family protein [Melioribacteraceae bacterium]MCF8264455.1 septum formation initiator family protein [Melioribacteraceae bacterium]MCF8414497.1 septum formation initiator family protein [Melioribacteraceae bacterium]